MKDWTLFGIGLFCGVLLTIVGFAAGELPGDMRSGRQDEEIAFLEEEVAELETVVLEMRYLAVSRGYASWEEHPGTGEHEFLWKRVSDTIPVN